MNFLKLPIVLEDIIISYKTQLEQEEHRIKFQKCLNGITKISKIDLLNKLLGMNELDEDRNIFEWQDMLDGGAELGGGATLYWG